MLEAPKCIEETECGGCELVVGQVSALFKMAQVSTMTRPPTQFNSHELERIIVRKRHRNVPR
jgi:hypothetical protein